MIILTLDQYLSQRAYSTGDTPIETYQPSHGYDSLIILKAYQGRA